MLFENTVLSGISLKNRIIRSATHDGLADENGAPSDKLIAKYEHLAKKLKNGQTESKCIMCNYCGLVIEKEPTKCLYGRVK